MTASASAVGISGSMVTTWPLKKITSGTGRGVEGVFVEVGVTVEVGVGVLAGVGVWVCTALGVRAGVGSAVVVAVEIGIGVGAWVGTRVGLDAGIPEGTGVAVGVGIAFGLTVWLGDGSALSLHAARGKIPSADIKSTNAADRISGL